MTRLVVCFFAALALATGCSVVNDPAQHMGGASDAGSDAPAPDRIEPSALCTRLVTLQCNQYVHCCSTAPMPFDVEACIETYLPSCRDSVGRYLADDRTGYDAETAARTVAQGEALSRDCSLDVARWVSTREGLFGAFAGTIAPGGDCTPTSAMDFAAFVSCDRLENACVPASGDRFLCAERVGMGTSCLLNGDCVAGLACLRTVPLDPGSGRCSPLLEPGAPCRQSTDCASYYCHLPAGLMIGTCVEATRDNIYCGVGD